MTIECYDIKCRFHSYHYNYDDGPFCDEKECHKKLTKAKLKCYANYILDDIRAKYTEESIENESFEDLLIKCINEIIENEKCHE